MSVRHGNLGVSNFLLCFLGSPMLFHYSSFFAAAALAWSSFFLTPNAFPALPVVLVLCPLTFSP